MGVTAKHGKVLPKIEKLPLLCLFHCDSSNAILAVMRLVFHHKSFSKLEQADMNEEQAVRQRKLLLFTG